MRWLVTVSCRVNLIDRVRRLCLAPPETFELETWDHPTFRVGGGRGKIFCLAVEPFYVPPYVGAKGWVGVNLDHPRTDREEVAELIATGYCLVAPKRLARTVASPPSLDD